MYHTLVTAARQQLSASTATHSASKDSVTWASIIMAHSVILQLSEGFNYPNTLRSQRVQISDFLLYVPFVGKGLKIMYHMSAGN